MYSAGACVGAAACKEALGVIMVPEQQENSVINDGSAWTAGRPLCRRKGCQIGQCNWSTAVVPS